MTNFPNTLDTDIELPPIFDNIVEAGSEAIQALRGAMFAVEENIGINANGSMGSVADRLNVSINSDGTIAPSALIGIGLIALPIYNDYISPTAAIEESKLNLTYTTQFLYNLFANLDAAVDILNGFVSVEGIRISPHIAGTDFRHKLSHIDVDAGTLNRVNISAGSVVPRNITNAYTFTSELSDDLLKHTRADKSINSTTPPQNQAHNASGIYINPTNFSSVPSTANDLQTFAEFVDSSSLVLLGSRTQNLFSNGVPRSTRNTSLINDKAAEAIVDPTPATAYLLSGSSTTPVDDIDQGDDVILLNPSAPVLASNVFDAQFAQVKPGDYITINYGDGYSPVAFTIDSTSKFLNGSSRVYVVRINGKNLFASTNATIRIDRPHYHDSKFNTLALAAAHNSFAELPSLIVSNPSGAAALGVGFDPDKIDQVHYNLYLELYPTGNPVQKAFVLPAIDVSGNQGSTPGSYSLNSVVEAINDKFRQPGFNFRLIAFGYQGQLGIALADRYNDASFSIISGTTDGYGNYSASSNSSFPGNVVDNFNQIDPLGFGSAAANIASPPFAISYSTPVTALQSPTIIFSPLKKNFYYVDGVERDSFALEVATVKDGYGDGYWAATLVSKQALSNRVEVTYEVPRDLSTSGLKIGKTIVVQPAVSFDSASFSHVDYGRFLITDIAFDNCNCDDPTASTTTITVYDAIHGTGNSPFLSSLNIPVQLYFSDDSVSFNTEHVSDPAINVSFKRFFEVYVNSSGKSFTHERARFNTSGSNLVVDSINSFTLYSSSEAAVVNLVDVSPKLRGYNYGQYRKIALVINNYNQTSGVLDGYLCKFDSPSTYSRLGPVVSGKKGEIVRFYDETTADYIDVAIPLDLSLSSFTNKLIDIQLFPSLQLNQEKIFIGSCQLNDTTKKISYLTDRRQFGNTSEKQLSTSALSYIAAPQRLLDENGVIRGFDLVSNTTLTNDNLVKVRGGTVLVDGKIIEFNDTTVAIPIVQETLFPAFSTTLNTIRWYLCVNSQSEFEFIASTDYDLALAGTYGALDQNRLFYVKNPASTSGTSYPIRSSYFNRLLLDLKDVVPLYVIEATVGLVSLAWKVSSATVSDARRFTEKGFRGLSHTFTLGNNASFRSLKALKTYLFELTNYIAYSNTKRNVFGTTVHVRDVIDVSGEKFDFPISTKFVGDDGSFVVSSSSTTLVKNTEFKDLNISVSAATGLIMEGDNIQLTNCNIDYTYNATGDGSFTAANLANMAKGCVFSSTGGATSNNRKNLVIDSCRFTTTQANHFAFVNFLLAGETHYYENIHITHNIFTNSVVADNKRAVIVFSANTTTTPSAVLGPRIVDCDISNNLCNKNQLIIMSGATNGSSKIANMPVAVGVRIEKNICGAICYLTRQDRSYNVYNATNINDKDSMMIIANNVCRYIYSGTNLGFINVVGSSNRVMNDIIVGSNVYSGSTIIENNVCSWIHVGVKNPTTYGFETPFLEISNNKLNAYLLTYLNDYHSVISPSNIGLIVDEVVGT